MKRNKLAPVAAPNQNPLAALPGGTPENAPAPAAPTEGVVNAEQNSASSLPMIDGEKENEEKEEKTEYHAHDEKEKTRGRQKGMRYEVRQRISTILRKVPNMRNVPFLISKKVKRSPEQIAAAFAAAGADGSLAKHFASGNADKFLASLAEEEQGGTFKLSEVMEKFGADYVMEIPQAYLREWAYAMVSGWFKNLLTVDAGKEGEETELGICTDENDPTIVREIVAAE
jgi:hypothetical protein